MVLLRSFSKNGCAWFSSTYHRINDWYHRTEEHYLANSNASRLVLWLSFLLTGLFIFLLNTLTPFFADDYSYRFIFGYSQPISCLGDLFLSLYHHYFNWGGRFIGIGLTQLFMFLGKPVFNILNTLAYVLFTALIYYICNAFQKPRPTLYMGISLLFWFFMPDYGQVVFWLSGSSGYLWTILPVLGIILIFRRYSLKQTSIKNNILNTVLLFFLGLLAGWSMENTAVGLFVVLTLYLIYFWLSKIVIPKWAVSGYLGSIIGFAFLLLAPGNFERAKSAYASSLVFRFFMVVYFGVAFMTALLIIYLVVLFMARRHFDIKSVKALPQSLIFAAAAFFSAICMVAAPTFPERSWLSAITFMIIAIGVVYSTYDFKMVTNQISNASLVMLRRSVTAVIVLSLCLFSVMAVDTVICSYDIYTQSAQRNEYILSEKENSHLDISVKEFSYKYPFLSKHDAFSGLYDVSSDSNFWINQAVAKYYGVNSITGLPADDYLYKQ